MVLLQKASLPSGDDSPVHIHLSILPLNNGYMAYINADMGMYYRFPISLQQHDVKDLNTRLQKAIEQVAISFENQELCGEALSNLAYEGIFAFNSIFPEGPAREKIRSALRSGVIIQIASDSFFIPWDLLYDGPLFDKVNISSFWGTDHIISRAIMQDIRPGDFIPSIIQTLRPKVGLLAYDKLEHVAKQEIPALRKLHRNKRISLSRLPALDSNQSKRDKELIDFGHFLGRNHQIIHFACHAYEQDPVSQSFLSISEDFHISITDFVVSEFNLTHNPFIILNACLTSVINPLYTHYWAAEFWKRGARGVLATDFHIPDRFAAEFSEELYQHLLSGKSIGNALATTRRHFWEKHCNPLGLAYALYSSPSIRLATQF